MKRVIRAVIVALCTSTSVEAQEAISPSPSWTKAMPSGPVAGMHMTEAYAALVARDAYVWAWPLVNMHNRRMSMEAVKAPIKAGPAILAPINTLAMLTDYIDPGERVAAHPNQDVTYGAGMIALGRSPVVIQVPDFGDRFWMFAVYDTRTDNVVQLGKMYGTTPGFYLLAGLDWQGAVPKGITRVFRSGTDSGMAAPRVFLEDTAEDRQAIQPLLNQIMMYPLAEFDGTMKSSDWSKLPADPPEASGNEEHQWVHPETFFDQLPAVLADAPPLPGEEARYAQVLAVVEAAKKDPKLKEAMTKAAIDADAQIVKPLFEFRNFGVELPYNWRTMPNGGAFGTDYYTRTAIAKSNIGVHTATEAYYFYQDFDGDGGRLHGSNRYTVTFARGQTPPVNGFWSLTMYNDKHFFVPNQTNRYSLGTKNKDLKLNADGSLTLYIQAEAPDGDQRSNWLPAPPDADFSMTIRAYWPKASILTGAWTPPAVQKVK